MLRYHIGRLKGRQARIFTASWKSDWREPKDIRANGAEAYVMRKFHGLIREMLRKSLKSAMVINILININQILFALGTAAAFAIGTYLFQNEIVTIGTVYIIYHYTSMLNRPMDSISHQVEQLQRASAGIVRIQALLAIESKIKTPGRETGRVTFRLRKRK